MSHLSEKDWLKHKDTHLKVIEKFFLGNTFSGPQRVTGASDVHMPVTLFTEPQEDQVIRLRTLALKQYGRSVSEAWIWGLPRW